MMNMRILVSLFAFSLLACNAEPETTTKTTAVKWTPDMKLGTATSIPVSNQNFPSKNTISGASVNPAHGQPGHRCDLPVGASLIAKKNPVASPKITTTPNPQPPTKNITGKLNPAHGQPNHRCDIAVGASLDSKPVQVTAANPAGVTKTGSNVQVYQPMQSKNTNGQKLNPAHGQPSHRCDIAVGAPLT
jgi:hypothetical protein